MSVLAAAPVTAPRAPRTAPTPRTARTPRPAPVRLTRRGRLVALAVLTLLAVTSVLLLGRVGAVAEAPTGAVPPAATELVVVQPGETLWSIAEAVDPQADPRETVERLRSLNGLEGSLVVPGQPIVVPARG
ncbi:MAG: LysM peptidoglycan-binding domain-containing protein [Candidatus Nanopelagicales bacterium]